MITGGEPMGAPTSFTARRPNASNLPQFELPPPQLPSFHKPPLGYGGHSSASSMHGIGAGLNSVGNLPTPPGGSSTDGQSPVSSAGALHSAASMAPYTPGAYSWHQPTSAGTPYGYGSSMSPGAYNGVRGPFSPLGQMIKNGTQSPHDSVAHGTTSGDVSHYSQSAPMTAPLSLPSLPNTQQAMSMVAPGPMSAPLSQVSPMNNQDGFARPQPPTPTYYGAQNSSAPAQSPFQYTTGQQQVQQSPAGSYMSRVSPPHGQMPNNHPQGQYAAQRPFAYLPGPGMSSMNNAGGQMGYGHGMMGHNGGFAPMQHLYGHGGPVGVANDRPFKCDQCPQSFNRNHDLKRHKRIHLAVKPFPCGYCDKSFSRKDALKRHVLVKGCGKADHSKGSLSEGSMSPGHASDTSERSGGTSRS